MPYRRSMPPAPHLVVIGGGIVGLSVAERLRREQPAARITVLEKETGWGRHQTGHNSGVIHSGIYYAPGSLKAAMCRAGAASMVAYAEAHGISYAVGGKLIVAASPDELPRLHALHERGLAHGLGVRRLTPAEALEHEPHVRSVGALHVPETGVIDYGAVCAALAAGLEDSGADLRLGVEVLGRGPGAGSTVVRTTAGDLAADAVVNCAGLQADTVATRLGHRSEVRIVPFRGEYLDLSPEAAHLVRGLVYPVPDPAFPFLGVHLTRGLDGHVHAGPNAVLALAREGYDWRTVRPREAVRTLTYPGLWRLGVRNARAAAMEVTRSLSTHRFGESVRRLVPEVRDEDLRRGSSGVRAQALRPDGSLVDDFLIETDGRVVHVLNAPSPAATSAFEIARHIVRLVT